MYEVLMDTKTPITDYRGRALLLVLLAVIACFSILFGSAAATVDEASTERVISDTEVSSGETVTVTVTGGFNETTDDAKLVDNINGQGISADNITITDADGGFGAVTSDPAVDVTWNDQLNTGLGSDSATVEYEITIPEDASVETTITFDGSLTDTNADDTTTVGGDTQIEVVSPLDPPAGEYDTNGDGEISVIELGNAGADFARGKLSISELAEVGKAFAS
jgi:hypothetical protein